MTPAELALVGAALYGPRWQTEMARALEVADRTVRRWAAGASPIPADVPATLGRIAKGRASTLSRAAAICAKAAAS